MQRALKYPEDLAFLFFFSKAINKPAESIAYPQEAMMKQHQYDLAMV